MDNGCVAAVAERNDASACACAPSYRTENCNETKHRFHDGVSKPTQSPYYKKVQSATTISQSINQLQTSLSGPTNLHPRSGTQAAASPRPSRAAVVPASRVGCGQGGAVSRARSACSRGFACGLRLVCSGRAVCCGRSLCAGLGVWWLGRRWKYVVETWVGVLRRGCFGEEAVVASATCFVLAALLDSRFAFFSGRTFFLRARRQSSVMASCRRNPRLWMCPVPVSCLPR